MRPPPDQATLATTMALVAILTGISGAGECEPCAASLGNGIAGSSSNSTPGSSQPYFICPPGAALTTVGTLLEAGGALDGMRFSCSDTPCTETASGRVYPYGAERARFSDMVCPVGDAGGVSTIYDGNARTTTGGGVNFTDGKVDGTALMSVECAGGLDCGGACGADTR